MRGITPAYAGKSHELRTLPRAVMDHPRVCGEKRTLQRRCPLRRGSPPRMRGKGRGRSFSSCELGITPAYAGKSPRPGRINSDSSDHPRVCGEKSLSTSGFIGLEGITPAYAGKSRSLLPIIVGMEGSPPRMRGKAVCRAKFCADGGITPAYAGKRELCLEEPLSLRDHPRVCGEKEAEGKRRPSA